MKNDDDGNNNDNKKVPRLDSVQHLQSPYFVRSDCFSTHRDSASPPTP